jgi:cbb3-type cytochrome oxidase cytochrome c subunit
MKGLIPLFVGLFGTFTFSWVGLTVIPNLQIGALNPQMDEEDRYPMPQSGMVEHGRSIYAANGCIYCHSRQVRPDYAASDIDRKWGVRRSAPRDYIFDRPVLLGKERMGPDLANIGKRGQAEESPAPSAAPASSPAQSPAATAQSPAANQFPPAPVPSAAAANASPATAANASPTASASPNPTGEPPLYSEAWHHKHLYAPRSMNPDTRDSTMPAYQFLYEKRRISGERSADALQLTGADAPPAGWEVVPTYEAKCLVAYLMAQDQTHPLKEVKSMPGAAPPAAASPAASPGAPAVAPAGSPAASPPPKK